VHWREARHSHSVSRRETALDPIGGTSGEAFRVVFTHRYLLLIAIFSLVFTLVKTNGDYLLSRIVKEYVSSAVAAGTLEKAHVEQYIGAFFASFQFNINLVSLLVQGFLVSRIVKYAGLRGGFYVLPFIALGNAALILIFPALAAVRFGKTAESAVDYSLNSTLRNMLWLPTSRRAKYLAKQATDTFFVRMGDVVSAVIVFVGVTALSLTVRGFAAINIALVVGWLLLAGAILRERGRLKSTESEEPERQPERPPALPARATDLRARPNRRNSGRYVT